MVTTETLRNKLEPLIRDSGAERVAVAYVDIATDDRLLLDADADFHAASTIKVCVMAALRYAAAAGRLSFDDPVTIDNRFASAVDGTPFSLSAQDDGDPSLYPRDGDAETVRELVRLMIVRSGNLATNLLLRLVSPAEVSALMAEWGAPGLAVRRLLMDLHAYDQGLNNTATARGLMRLLRGIARGEVVSPTASAEMVEVMLGQEFNHGLPAGLPPDTPVAHKTGSVTGICHDAGIIYPAGRPPYVLVVLTQGMADHDAANALIAEVSRTVWEHCVA